MTENTHQHRVRIHIDQEPYHSPNPTNGEALYVLGEVKPGLQLFREVSGNREDEEVPNGPQAIHLRPDEHFHSGPAKAKVYHIVVNAQPRTVSTKIISYDEVIAIAYPTPPPGSNIIYSVGYEDGPPENPEGILRKGAKVHVKDGMIFNVSATDKS